jgi:hypothetical protein
VRRAVAAAAAAAAGAFVAALPSLAFVLLGLLRIPRGTALPLPLAHRAAAADAFSAALPVLKLLLLVGVIVLPPLQIYLLLLEKS